MRRREYNLVRRRAFRFSIGFTYGRHVPLLNERRFKGLHVLGTFISRMKTRRRR